MGGRKVIMEVPLVTLASRMTHWGVGGIQSHPLVSFSSSRWVAAIGVDRFCGLQTGCHVGQDDCETRMVLWDQLGWHGQVGVFLPTEPDTHALVREKREWRHSNLW